MRVLIFTLFRVTFSFRIFAVSALWRVLLSRLVLLMFYSKLNQSASRALVARLGIDPQFLPHLTTHSLRATCSAPIRQKKAHRTGQVLVFQNYAPRFGNSVISLILIHHLTKNSNQPLEISLAKSKWMRSLPITWNRRNPVSAARNLVRMGSWPETVISHNNFFLPVGPEAFRLAAREAREDIMKTLTLQQQNISLPQTREVLTVHIRGGDVFSRKPHPEYAPPPLAFYTGIIKGGDWHSIRIVSEDVNPLSRALVSWLRKYGINWEINVPNLSRDISVLSTSQSLVAGRGTFIPSIAYLSAHIDTIFAIDSSIFAELTPRSATVISPPGDWDQYFSLIGAWKAESEQLSMMASWTPRI